MSGLRLTLYALVFAGLAAGCAVTPPQRPEVYEQVGLASYYHDDLHGRKTASGETYDRNDLTAAHRTLPFGSVVAVSHLKTGRTVKVRINDRGPYIKGRIIDLSYAAAQKLGIRRQGVARVRVTLD